MSSLGTSYPALHDFSQKTIRTYFYYIIFTLIFSLRLKEKDIFAFQYTQEGHIAFCFMQFK